MIDKLLEGVGDKLADRWVAASFTPAFLFWAGGLGAWIWTHGWVPLEAWFTAQLPPLQIVIVIGALIGIIVSSFMVQRFDRVVIRFLEGYWPRWMGRIRSYLIKRHFDWYTTASKRYLKLKEKGQTNLTTKEAWEVPILEWDLRYTPTSIFLQMPTRLGNVIRSAEGRPTAKYGLDAVICWPRLWLLLPDTVKNELNEARATLNTAARMWLWGILFLIWGVWAWWAPLIGIIVALFSYHWLIDAAISYGDLLESAFDTHRTLLYNSLRWPLPANPSEEKQLGSNLTQYLWRGPVDATPTFRNVDEKQG